MCFNKKGVQCLTAQSLSKAATARLVLMSFSQNFTCLKSVQNSSFYKIP